MHKLRGTFAVVVFVGSALAAGFPMGCLPELPEANLPETPKLEAPQMPEIPQFEPPEQPELAPPDAPQTPVPSGLGGGNCCIRTGVLAESKCKGAASCCVKAIEDMGACEDAKGFWFFTPEGCAGAC